MSTIRLIIFYGRIVRHELQEKQTNPSSHVLNMVSEMVRMASIWVRAWWGEEAFRNAPNVKFMRPTRKSTTVMLAVLWGLSKREQHEKIWTLMINLFYNFAKISAYLGSNIKSFMSAVICIMLLHVVIIHLSFFNPLTTMTINHQLTLSTPTSKKKGCSIFGNDEIACCSLIFIRETTEVGSIREKNYLMALWHWRTPKAARTWGAKTDSEKQMSTLN